MTALTPDIPVIETERLVLREPREDDMPASTAFIASERASFVGGGAEGHVGDGHRDRGRAGQRDDRDERQHE